MKPSCAIGVDLGGTKCAAGLVRIDDGHVLARRLQPTHAQRGGQAVLDDVIRQIRSLQDEAAGLYLAPTAIGIGVAELVSVDGAVLSDATIKWRGLPIAAQIRLQCGLLTRVDADVRAAARGEALFGAGRGLASFLYVTVGTGISASLVLDGIPYPGTQGLTGTIASGRGLIAGDDCKLVGGPPLEQFAAGPALAARFAAGGGNAATAPEVVALADAGDPLAKSVVESAGEALGAAIAHLINTLDPAAVVIGGGLGLVGGCYRAAMERALRQYIWSDLHRDLPLVAASLGVDAGMIGAALGQGQERQPC